MPGFDVVTVPDFSSPGRTAVFEARALFFLASWLENAGQARAFPLHLACIGAPPASVRRLAAECGAAVEVCEPLGLAGRLTANKLRGLEVPVTTGRLLMLDTDLFVLGDFSALAAEIPAGLAAAPAGSKWVPEALWKQIYDHLGLPEPEERVALLRVEYGLVPPDQLRRSEFGAVTNLGRMRPYFNSGVFLTPADTGLREVWADHLVRLAALFPVAASLQGTSAAAPIGQAVAGVIKNIWARLTRPRVKYPRSVTTCDQAAFSTAIQTLRARSIPFQRLPDAYHARRVHCQAGRVRLDDIKIYHATGFLRPGRRERWDLERALDQGIGQWQESLRAGGRFRDQAEADDDAVRAGELLARLYHGHVRPALAETRGRA